MSIILNKFDRASVIRRLDQHSMPVPECGCQIWLGYWQAGNYGTMTVGGHGGASLRVHRLSWVIHNGPIPAGLHVLHHCDTPPCIRPDHLFLGTNQDNIDDKTRKGRTVCFPGESNPASKLTAVEVLAIRASSSSQRTIAKQFGISQTLVGLVRRREYWGHI